MWSLLKLVKELQLILLPWQGTGKVKKHTPRGDAGFGSSDVYWIKEIKRDRPELNLKIEGKMFKGILDTGADVSVIAEAHWPQAWPLQSALTDLRGIGQTQNPQISSKILHWQDEEGHSGTFQPYVVAGLPVNLWGRDIMAEMGVYLHSPCATVTQQMMNQGFLPGQGLGKNNQGSLDPVSPKVNLYREGLGSF